jgi:hypothetical protein
MTKRQFVFLLMRVMPCLLGAPSLANALDWGPASLRLSEGMTEQQAIAAIGYRPSRAELTTCGQNTDAGAWDCRILTFGDRYSSLVIHLRQEGQSWFVNDWNVYPSY